MDEERAGLELVPDRNALKQEEVIELISIDIADERRPHTSVRPLLQSDARDARGRTTQVLHGTHLWLGRWPRKRQPQQRCVGKKPCAFPALGFDHGSSFLTAERAVDYLVGAHVRLEGSFHLNHFLMVEFRVLGRIEIKKP